MNITFGPLVVAVLLGTVLGWLWHVVWPSAKNIETPLRFRGRCGVTIVSIMSALVLGVLFNSLVVVGLSGIVLVGLVVWLGFVAPAVAYVQSSHRMPRMMRAGDFLLTFLIIMLETLIIGIFS